jgi:hypothetical protein
LKISIIFRNSNFQARKNRQTAKNVSARETPPLTSNKGSRIVPRASIVMISTINSRATSRFSSHSTTTNGGNTFRNAETQLDKFSTRLSSREEWNNFSQIDIKMLV